MKRIITLMTLLIAFTCALHAQEAPKYYYAEVVELTNLGTSISVDFGLNAPFGTSYKITDESGDTQLGFKNTIAALNYLSEKGWRVISVTYQDMGKAGRKTVYLLEFDASKHEMTALAKAAKDAVQTYL